jgi:aspartyl-tRNA(Asn)/glutamyl-tRNA(Gln) amidotransferase subunit B
MEKFGKSELVSVQLTRAHLEEDAGKSIHEDSQGTTSVDLNRAGIPLLEIVTEPNIRSATEAVAYAKSLHALVVWIGICDGNMQEGSFRCDVNISIRPFGKTTYNNRVEIKNLNSFRFIEETINYEIKRQVGLMEDDKMVVQETRLYDPSKKETRSMRSKENSQDYRYFPDPDLPPLLIETEWIERIRSSMPELPSIRRERFIHDFMLSEYDSMVLTQSKAMADYFEMLVMKIGKAQAKLAANWIIGDLLSIMNREGININETRVSAAQLAGLLRRLTDGTISNKIAKEVFSTMWKTESTHDTIAEEIIEGKKLKQISNINVLEEVIDVVLAENIKLVKEVNSGKEKAFNALIGEAMRVTKGKANPSQLRKLLEQKINKLS